MRIKNNIAAMNVRRNQANNNRRISKSLEKLSSGYRINRAGDDAAGLAISEKMRAQISGLDQATENCKHGINLFKTADGALGDVTAILQRMNELCVKAGNETYGDEERQAIQAEIDNLLEEAGRISKAANYNDIPLMTVPAKSSVDVVFIVDTTENMQDMISSLKDHVGSYVNQFSAQGLDVRLGLVDYRDYGDDHVVQTTPFTEDAAAFAAALAGLPVEGGGPFDADEAGLEAIMDGALSLNFKTNTQKVFVMVTDGGLHQKGDTADYKYSMTEVADKLKAQNVQLSVFCKEAGYNNEVKTFADLCGGDYFKYDAHTGLGIDLIQNGFTQATTLSTLSYFDLPLQIGDSAEDQELFRLWEVSPDSLNINDVAVDPIEKLYESLAKVKAAINSVSSIRGEYGAYVNRLEHTLEALGVNLENLSASESAIRDTDMADEMTELTKHNILSQASQAMLSQANATPQGVLKLLQ